MEAINLNIIPNGVTPVCHVSQYDEGRQIKVNLFEGNTPYNIQSGDTFTLNVRKPDNTIITTTSSSIIIYSTGNNYITIKTTQQIAAVVGETLCELRITNGSTVIGTLNFIMLVERDVISDGIASQSVIEDLDSQIENILGDELDEILQYSVVDLLYGELTKRSSSSSGITFTWDGDTCTVNGTCTATTVNLLRSSTALPFGVNPNEKVYVKYQTTDANLRLRIIFRDANNVDITGGTFYFTGNRVITVPAQAGRMTISLYVTTGTVLNNAVVTKVAMLNSKTNDELDTDINTLGGNVLQSRGILATNTDLDDVRQTGAYVLDSSRTYPHLPYEAGYAGFLLVFYGTNNTVAQIAIRQGMPNAVFTRISRLGSFEYDWTTVGLENGILTNNTDLDTVTNFCSKVLNSSYSYPHSPLPSGSAGTLLVFRSTINTILQVVIGMNGAIYLRTSLGGVFSLDWVALNSNTYVTQYYENTYNITCEPDITTDTNNFLASTGDDTDRTGDIQTMLNNTGVCHLGAGLFVVSGIEIPSYATLIGSGNRTTLRLNASVTEGYTVKLKSQSSIKNLRITGGTEAPALSDNLGSRNGIIFEGTRVPNDDTGTTYKRASITDCIIYYFSGSGILCNKTGTPIDSNLIIANTFVYSCGAGLNIAFYSEFHRIVNSTFQYNYYGVIDNGGNNNFSNCDFSGNRIGILIDNSTDQSNNNSHGSFNNCSVNHSISAAGVANEGIAIKLLKSNLGEIFTGMQIFYGALIFDRCVGTRFIGANIGRKVPITITNSTVVTFSDCTFQQPPTDSDATFTQSNNTVLKFTDCYLRTGVIYDPMS